MPKIRYQSLDPGELLLGECVFAPGAGRGAINWTGRWGVCTVQSTKVCVHQSAPPLPSTGFSPRLHSAPASLVLWWWLVLVGVWCWCNLIPIFTRIRLWFDFLWIWHQYPASQLCSVRYLVKSVREMATRSLSVKWWLKPCGCFALNDKRGQHICLTWPQFCHGQQ